MHVNRRDDGTYDIMYSNTNAEFTLTPDIVVVQKSISVTGGIYNRVRDEEYKRPKDLTDEDLKTLFSFFQIIGLKILANAIGYKLKFPNMKN